MANVIQTKRSLVAATVPPAGSLAEGQLAVNIADAIIWVGDAAGDPVELGGGGGGAGLWIGDTAPTDTAAFPFWWNSTPGVGELRVYFTDADSSQWVRANSGMKGDTGPIGPKGDTGAEGTQGDIGPIGPEGQQGIQGVEGPQGGVGPIGPAGKLSYTIIPQAASFAPVVADGSNLMYNVSIDAAVATIDEIATSGFEVGEIITFMSTAGSISIAAGAGLTGGVNVPVENLPASYGAYSTISVVYLDAVTCLIYGDMAGV